MRVVHTVGLGGGRTKRKKNWVNHMPACGLGCDMWNLCLSWVYLMHIWCAGDLRDLNCYKLQMVSPGEAECVCRTRRCNQFGILL